MVSQEQCDVILRNLDQRIHIVNHIVGETMGEAILRAPDAGSLADTLNVLLASFQADPNAFVHDEHQIRTFAELVRAYKALAFDPVHDLSEITDILAGVAAGHEHTWTDIREKPDRFPPEAHTHDWQDLTNPGDPLHHQHTWDQITKKPSHFTADVHQHTWTETLYKPLEFPPEAHTHLWEALTNPPAAFPPEAHTHLWEALTNPPAAFPPEAHTQPWDTITGKPMLLDCWYGTYSGDGSPSKRLPIPETCLCYLVLITNTSDNILAVWFCNASSMVVLSHPPSALAVSVQPGACLVAGQNVVGKHYRWFVLGTRAHITPPLP